MPLSGPRPTCWTRDQSGAVDEKHCEDFSELDPEWTKWQLFGRHCFDLGHTVTKGNGLEVKKERIKIGWSQVQNMDMSAHGDSFGAIGGVIIQK
jgi:hypothetical protein